MKNNEKLIKEEKYGKNRKERKGTADDFLLCALFVNEKKIMKRVGKSKRKKKK